MVLPHLGLRVLLTHIHSQIIPQRFPGTVFGTPTDVTPTITGSSGIAKDLFDSFRLLSGPQFSLVRHFVSPESVLVVGGETVDHDGDGQSQDEYAS